MDTDEILPMNIGFLIGDVDGFLKMGQGSETAPPLRRWESSVLINEPLHIPLPVINTPRGSVYLPP